MYFEINKIEALNKIKKYSKEVFDLTNNILLFWTETFFAYLKYLCFQKSQKAFPEILVKNQKFWSVL